MAAAETGTAAGKVAVVTGAGGAIGRACAVLLGRAGARLVVTEAPGRGGEDTAAIVTAEGGTARFFPHDIGAEDDWRRLVDDTLNRWHRLDILSHTVHVPLERALADFTRAAGHQRGGGLPVFRRIGRHERPAHRGRRRPIDLRGRFWRPGASCARLLASRPGTQGADHDEPQEY